MKDDLLFFAFSCMICLFIGLAIGGCLGEQSGINKIQKEAIKLNHAEWVADQNGNAQWQWKSK